MGKILKSILKVIFLLILAVVLFTLALNMYICDKGRAARVVSYQSNDQRLTTKQQARFKKLDPQCIIVLGAGIKNEDEPTDMLRDRLAVAVKLYKAGIAPKILLTGDNGTVQHNEIHVMLLYMKKEGIPDKDIFCDHAGFSTYDSMYRANSIFQVKRAVVVTQTYHLYRALFIGDHCNMKLLGAGSDQGKYQDKLYRNAREYAARIKDTGKLLKHAGSILGGNPIPITGNGISSHGE